jgi:hypothetical protein
VGACGFSIKFNCSLFKAVLARTTFVVFNIPHSKHGGSSESKATLGNGSRERFGSAASADWLNMTSFSGAISAGAAARGAVFLPKVCGLKNANKPRLMRTNNIKSNRNIINE